jgi:hypothetical protein
MFIRVKDERPPAKVEDRTVKRERESSQNIKTIGALLGRRRARTSGSALLELLSLSSEQTRLEHELARRRRRRVEIESRLREIADKVCWLHSVVEQACSGESARLPTAGPPECVYVRELNH